MSQEIVKFDVNKAISSENSSKVKEEFQSEYYQDDKVCISETTITNAGNISNSNLDGCIKNDKIGKYEMLFVDNIKTDLPSTKVNVAVSNNIKIEDGICLDFCNELLFCNHCHEVYQNYCTKCRVLTHILNERRCYNIYSRIRELPIHVLETRESIGHLGIFSLKAIPEDVRFGPFTGLKAGFSLKIKGGRFVVKDDKSEHLNWMQYINPARDIYEQNLLPFQYEDKLYYCSTRRIQEGEELLVYFGEEYEDNLLKNVEMDFVPIAKENFENAFACTFCCLGFRSKEYLADHKAVCHGETNKILSEEELAQCPFCKIYLEAKEYLDHHKDYCYETNASVISVFINKMSLKKRKCLTLYEKSLVIQELNTQSVTYLAKKYGVAKSTICKIKQKKTMISTAVRDTYVGPGKRRTLKNSEFPKMEKILYRWFLDQRNKNVIVTGEIIRQQARLIHSQTRENDKQFTASEGWLQRFKKRFGIRFLKIPAEKMSCQPELVDPFKIQFKNKIEEFGITLEQLYKADKAGLYWKLLPDKIFVSANEKTAGGIKTEKQRISFLACTNATGSHKVKPLVIGKTTNPRLFENFKCPVDYEHSKSALMTSCIFKHWFHYSFVPQVKTFLQDKGLPIKAFLLINNAPCYPSEDELKTEDGQIVTMFLPPNITPLTQPIDQNVIKLTKLYYRNNLLSTVAENDMNISDTLKKLSIRDAVSNLVAAWSHLNPEMIKKCWGNILDGVSNKDDCETAPLAENSMSKSLELLRILAPQAAFEETDVLEWNQCDTELNETTEFENDAEESEQAIEKNSEPLNKVSLDSAINALNLLTQWAEQNDIDMTDLAVIKRIREKAIMQKKSPETNKNF